MKKSNLLKVVGTTFTLSMLLSFTSLAAWQQDTAGWWYQNDNGGYPTNCWQWIDGNNDGIAESYYFDSNGYCLQDTMTPDGYTVNASGAWTVNGAIQTQAVVQTSETQGTATDTQMEQVQAIMPVEVDAGGYMNYSPEGLNLEESQSVTYDNCVSYWVENPRMSEDYVKEMLNENHFSSLTEEQRLGMIKGVLTKYPHNPAETIPYEDWEW